MNRFTFWLSRIPARIRLHYSRRARFLRFDWVRWCMRQPGYPGNGWRHPHAETLCRCCGGRGIVFEHYSIADYTGAPWVSGGRNVACVACHAPDTEESECQARYG